MKNILLLLISLFLFSSLHAQNDKRLKGLDKEMEEILEATQAAGFAVAVVEKDQVVYAKGFGYADYENKIPADANTLFAIGSSTKAFTSAILGQMRDEEKLTFQESPEKYIHELTFYNDELNSNVNISDLMCHRTGIPRHDLSWYFFPTDDRNEMIERIAHHEPFTGLREQWYYNNFMFLVQGVIAERISGKSWEDNVRERFFEPLGMDRSNLTLTEMERASNAAFGYELLHDSIISKTDYYDISAMSPAGSINSSVNDMSKWLITWINNGKYEGEEIIPENYRNEAITPQMVMGRGLPGAEHPELHHGSYGYGWMMMSYDGHYRVEHGGNIDGFSASVSFFPTDSIGIVVLANQNGSAVPYLVRNTISERMLEIKDREWIKTYKKEQAERRENEAEAEEAVSQSTKSNSKPSHRLVDYTGEYNHPGYGTFTVSVENDSLYAHFKLMKIWLKHVHFDVFEPFEVTETGIDTSDSSPLRFNFISNVSGDISHMRSKLEATLDPLEFKRTPGTIEVEKNDLEQYVGTYDLMGTDIKIYIKNDKTLYLFVAGQPEYELLATEKHKFSFKDLDGFKVEFKESEDGAIDEMFLIQPHGNFTVKRKK